MRERGFKPFRHGESWEPADWKSAAIEELAFRLGLTSVLLVALAVRLIHLDSSSYGLDEILQTYFVHSTWRHFWESLSFDAVHPPLDYLIGRAIEALGPADWVRKLPAILWGVGTIAALAVFLRRRAGSLTGLVAALLFALAPFHVRYSQEFRPYSLGLFLISLSMLLLDRLFERPGWRRLVGFFGACLATAYALYLAAVVLGVAAVGFLAIELFSPDRERQLRARRFLAWSPMFLLALFLLYLPWFPVVLTAMRRSSPTQAPAFELTRLGRLLSFFAFAPEDGQPLGRKGPLFVMAVAFGLGMAYRRRPLRVLVVWLTGGLAIIEVLEHLHPHWYVTRHFLPAGVVFPTLAALPIAWLIGKRRLRALGVFCLALFVLFDLRSLAVYYREGRPDWRPLGRYLRARPRQELIFAENQYTALCTAFYVVGPRYLDLRGHTAPKLIILQGNPLPIAWVWRPGTTAWLVLAGGGRHYPILRQWSRLFPGIDFPRAEGATLRRLDPTLWARMTETIPRTYGGP